MGKHNLYLASYDDTRTNVQQLQIHWALLVGPSAKHEDPSSFKKSNVRYHVTSTNGRWEFDRREIECVRTPAMLGRVLLGTIDKKDLNAVDNALSDRRRIRANSTRWDCRQWVAEALITLAQERWLRLEYVVHLDHLFRFAQRFSEEVIQKGLNVGCGVPKTVKYLGPRVYS